MGQGQAVPRVLRGFIPSRERHHLQQDATSEQRHGLGISEPRFVVLAVEEEGSQVADGGDGRAGTGDSGVTSAIGVLPHGVFPCGQESDGSEGRLSKRQSTHKTGHKTGGQGICQAQAPGMRGWCHARACMVLPSLS